MRSPVLRQVSRKNTEEVRARFGVRPHKPLDDSHGLRPHKYARRAKVEHDLLAALKQWPGVAKPCGELMRLAKAMGFKAVPYFYSPLGNPPRIAALHFEFRKRKCVFKPRKR